MNETNWQFYLNGEAAWEAMYSSCESAVKSIDLEQFIFNYDEVGRKFYRLFIEKAKQGVKIRLLFDAGGSYAFFNSVYHKQLLEQGIELQFFNPIHLWRLDNVFAYFFRDHRKLLVVDSEVAFTGGIGIEARMKEWRDTKVRITGPVVREIIETFELIWGSAKIGAYRRQKRVPARAEFNFLINSPRFHQRYFYHELIDRLRRAKRLVYIAVPYFVPNQRLLYHFRKAVQRGVEVRLLLPEASDHDWVDAAGRSYIESLLKHGVRIYQYQEIMMHSKVMIIDDEWSTVGSANLDSLSLVYNYEGNLVSTNMQFASELKGQFMNDLDHSIELKLDVWRRRALSLKIHEILTLPWRWIL